MGCYAQLRFENPYSKPLFRREILTGKVGGTYLVLVCNQGSLVGLCTKDYKSLCAAVTVCATLVNISISDGTSNFLSCLLYYCKLLPLPYIIDQRRILFWKKISCSENSVIRSISVLNTCIGRTLSKYSLQSLYLNSSQIKYHMWKHFVDTSVF